MPTVTQLHSRSCELTGRQGCPQGRGPECYKQEWPQLLSFLQPLWPPEEYSHIHGWLLAAARVWGEQRCSRYQRAPIAHLSLQSLPPENSSVNSANMSQGFYRILDSSVDFRGLGRDVVAVVTGPSGANLQPWY